MASPKRILNGVMRMNEEATVFDFLNKFKPIPGTKVEVVIKGKHGWTTLYRGPIWDVPYGICKAFVSTDNYDRSRGRLELVVSFPQ